MWRCIGIGASHRITSRGGERPVAPTSRSRMVFLAAVVALVALPLPAASGAPSKVLVLKASRSASVDITFARDVAVDSDSAKVSGAGSFHGFYMQPLGGRSVDATGALFIRAFRVPSIDWLPLPLGEEDGLFVDDPPRTLRAGRYRLHVLSDRPAEVRIPISGHPGGTLTATRATAVSFVAADVTSELVPRVPGTATPGVVVKDLPITVPAGKPLALSAVQVIRHGTSLAVLTSPSCIGAAERPACAGETKEVNGAAYRRAQNRYDPVTTLGTYEDETARYYYPGQITGGRQAAHFAVAASNLIDRVVVAAIAVAL